MADENAKIATTGGMGSPMYETFSDLGDIDLENRSDWGNKLVVNTGTHPVINFAFMLRVEGVFDLPCKSVKGIRRENEFDYIQEGGLNDYVHLKRKPLSKPCTFQVERYVGVNWIDPMPLGTELVLPVILFVNKYCFPTLKPVRTYTFTGCTVISKDYGELNAEVSGLLLETVTIAYREMVCLDIPSETLESDAWKFKGKEREGEGTRKYNSNLLNKEWETIYASRQMMEQKADAHKWKAEKDASGKIQSKYGKDAGQYAADYNAEIDKQIAATKDEEEKERLMAMKMGAAASRKYTHSKDNPKNYSSAKHHETELSRAAMEKAADEHRWAQTKDEKGNLVSKAKYGRDAGQYAADYNAEIDKKIAATKDEAEKKRLKAMKMGAADSRQYTHSKDNPKNYSSAKHHASELGKAAMEKTADEHRWKQEKDKNGKLVTKAKYGRDYAKYVTDYNTDIDSKIEAAKGDTKEQNRLKDMKKTMGSSASRQYTHSKDNPKNYSSATHHETELGKAAMEAAADAHKWNPKDSEPKRYGRDYAKYVTDYNTDIDNKIEAAKGDTEEQNRLKDMKKTMGSSASRQYTHTDKNPKNYSSAKHHENEMSKADMEKAAVKHAVIKETPKNYNFAKHNDKELSKSAMEVKAKLWPKTKSAKQITDFLKNH